MRISGIGNGTYSDALPAGRKSEPNESSPAVLTSLFDEIGVSTEESSSTPSETLSEILAQYDVTNITPRQFSELLQKLHKTGAVSDETMKELALVRADLDREGVEPDEPMDLVEFYTDQLDSRRSWNFETAADEHKPSESDLSYRLGWLNKFSLLHSAPDSLGLDEKA